jgi:hypothetical protein
MARMDVLISPVLVLLCWLPFSRARALRWIFFGFMAALTAVGALMLHLVPRAGAEVMFGTAVAGGLAAFTCLICEVGHLGPARRYWGFGVAAGALAAFYLVALVLVVVPAPFYPSTDEVPEDLHGQVQPRRQCGVGVCIVDVKVSGKSVAEVEAEVKPGCRPAGLWLDRTSICVEVSPRSDGVEVLLEGSRD